MKIIKYTIIALTVAGTLFTGCSKDEPVPSKTRLELKTITAKVGSQGVTKTVDTNDPTMSGMEERMTHTMNVTIGSAPAVAYKYSDGKWVPEEGPGAVFTSYANEGVAITVGKRGDIVQDGTARALIDADQLEWKNASQKPVSALSGIVMTHAKTLIELDLSMIADNAAGVKVGEAEAHNITGTKRWQAIVEPGLDKITVRVIVGTDKYGADIDKSKAEGGVFAPNCRYTVQLSVIGRELVVSALLLTPWAETVGGEADEVTTTMLMLDSENIYSAVTVAYTDGTSLEAHGTGNTFVLFSETNNNRMIHSIKIGGKEILVGRREGSTITLKVNATGGVQFRNGGDHIPIGTVEEFRMISTALTGNYKQEDDLDLLGDVQTPLTPLNWEPIGKYSSSNPAISFSGTYDGGGHKITNLKIEGTKTHIGLFGYNTGVLKNIQVASGQLNGEMYIGGVCGSSDGTISGCSNTSTVNGVGVNSSGIGGICGWNTASISDCHNTGAVNGKNYVGGVCGHSSVTTAKIENCSNSGNVTATGTNTGGVCGLNKAAITGCHNTGTVNGGDYTGGVCGTSYNIISGCSNEGAVSGGKYIGGVCGDITNTIIENCSNKGAVKGIQDVGGVCGYNPGTVSGCSNSGEVTATGNEIGGVCGYITGTVSGCSNSGEVKSAGNDIGGICGYNKGKTISSCHNTGAVSGGARVGGVCGYITDNTAIIEGCSNSKKVTATGDEVGGVCGYNYGSTISRCSNTGAVSGQNYAGGVCGRNALTITDCHNTGAVNGISRIGGICGANVAFADKTENCSNSGDVTATGDFAGGVCGDNSYCGILACYNTGRVSGSNYTGGVSGSNSSFGTISACYNTNAVNGKQSTGGVCGQNESGTISACYNTGVVNGGSPVGGVCGRNYNSTANCFWVKHASGANAGIGSGSGNNILIFGAISAGVSGWPTDNTSNGGHAAWGPAYWKSLGGWYGGSPIYPKLYWE